GPEWIFAYAMAPITTTAPTTAAMRRYGCAGSGAGFGVPMISGPTSCDVEADAGSVSLAGAPGTDIAAPRPATMRDAVGPLPEVEGRSAVSEELGSGTGACPRRFSAAMTSSI